VSRYRTNIPALNGGADCIGPDVSYRKCNASECFVFCGSTQTPLSTCASQLDDPTICAGQTCAAYGSFGSSFVKCLPNPCNSCQAGFFINGVVVDCTAKKDATNGYGEALGDQPPALPVPPSTQPNDQSKQSVSLVNGKPSGASALSRDFMCLVLTIVVFVLML